MGVADKGKDFLDSEEGEKTSDDALQKGSDFADKKTGGEHTEHLDKGTDAADKKVGDE
ncbi:hypothetical protein GCM10023169_09850 [Georgenia halophila]|uniref:MT0933-like antitoxin protein n=1 Tax=Georgenia halophila TaxID=620889 RepID=A0ABP8KYP1_9MICO